MTTTATELDFSVLTELDFPIPCALKGHGEEATCDDGPAVWIIEMSHACSPKVLPVCDKFVKIMTDPDTYDETTTGLCGHVIPFDEFFRVIGRV